MLGLDLVLDKEHLTDACHVPQKQVLFAFPFYRSRRMGQRDSAGFRCRHITWHGRSGVQTSGYVSCPAGLPTPRGPRREVSIPPLPNAPQLSYSPISIRRCPSSSSLTKAPGMSPSGPGTHCKHPCSVSRAWANCSLIPKHSQVRGVRGHPEMWSGPGPPWVFPQTCLTWPPLSQAPALFPGVSSRGVFLPLREGGSGELGTFHTGNGC